MHWNQERYIRVYTRDTPELVDMPWEARALWWEILRKADRAGVIPMTRSGARGLAHLVHMPVEVVEEFLPYLLAEDPGDPSSLPPVVIRGGLLHVRNYVEAQESPQTDAARKRAQRERSRAGSERSEMPYAPDQVSRAVTRPPDAGHDVTPIRSEPIHTDPSRAERSDARARKAVPEDVAGSPEAAALLAELRRHPALDPIAHADVAGILEGRRMSSGRSLAHVLAAIGELAADAVPGWSEETLRRKVRAYCDRARAPNEARAGPGYGPAKQPVPGTGREWEAPEEWAT